MPKTNKSYSKRIRVTKTGKLIRRKPGQDHFNAKQTGLRSMAGKRKTTFKITQKARSRFLPSK